MNNSNQLIELRSGSPDAFARLVEEFRVPVINICFRFLLNREDAEDVAQEVFIEIFHSLKHFRGDSKLSTWIYRIAVTKSLDEIKKRKRKKRITSIGQVLHLDKVADWLVGKQRPDTLLEEKQDYSQLLEMLNRLPQNQRIALTLSKIQGYSNPEIAEIMQTTLQAVDSLIYRAKQQLKKSLETGVPENK